MQDILNNTPWWVYVLFFILIPIGLRSTKSRTLSFHRLLLLPGVFTLWNIGWLVERTHEEFFLFGYWVIGVVIGSGLGWLSVRYWHVQADRKRKMVTLPGSWSSLILILLVFATRYAFIYQYEVHPDKAADLFTADAAVSGVITGMFIGRSIELYRKYRSS